MCLKASYWLRLEVFYPTLFASLKDIKMLHPGRQTFALLLPERGTQSDLHVLDAATRFALIYITYQSHRAGSVV